MVHLFVLGVDDSPLWIIRASLLLFLFSFSSTTRCESFSAELIGAFPYLMLCLCVSQTQIEKKRLSRSRLPLGLKNP